MKRSARLHRQRAFLMLDAIVAIFVATLVMVSVISVLLTGAVAAEAARQNTIANNCARQILENVRLRRGAMLVDGSYTDASVFGPVPQLTTLRDGAATVKISSWQSTVKSVVITVNWKAGMRGGLARTRVINGLVGPRGVSL